MPQAKAVVIGAGLSGTEAALLLARSGISVDLYEMRPDRMTPAHATGLPAELVCSNSFKSTGLHSAHGVLKAELALLGSPLLEAAHRTAVAAGSALAVDRLAFSQEAERLLAAEPNIRLIHKEITEPPHDCDLCIIAAGPLVSEPLAHWLAQRCNASALHFYDAIAPIIDAASIDHTVAFLASRRERDGSDYLNCPFTEDEYRRFHAALVEADRTVAHLFENERFFEACLPVEVLAGRGADALAFGPLKPIGLTDPRTGRRPFAVCQLRRENSEGTCFNMVGFQTRLTIPEQRRVFRLIPGLEQAEFLRYGSIHRNTYIDSPGIVRNDLSLSPKSAEATPEPALYIAGQLSGGEGYTESIATGHLAALFARSRLAGNPLAPPPRESALGSLLFHITGSIVKPFTPSNIHFGLFPPLPDNGKRIKKRANRDLLAQRAIDSIKAWMEGAGVASHK